MSDKLSHDDFIVRAIDRLMEPRDEGIHSVNSGLIEAMMKYYGIKQITANLLLSNVIKKGTIVARRVDDGYMLYSNCVFITCHIKAWIGGYGRIEGRDYVFRIKWNNDRGNWWLCISQNTPEGTALCWAHNSEIVCKLVEAVNRGKQHLVPGHQAGGSFQVNEFGQVLVPASDGSGQRVIVGEIKGAVLFDDPLTGKHIDLSDCRKLKAGDVWDRPYVGIPYNLSKASRIYFWRITSAGGNSEYLPAEDDELVSKLRAIRRSGAVRFVVNPYGIVLTKRPKNQTWNREEEWEPVFVGNIKPQYWFKKEV